MKYFFSLCLTAALVCGAITYAGAQSYGVKPPTHKVLYKTTSIELMEMRSSNNPDSVQEKIESDHLLLTVADFSKESDGYILGLRSDNYILIQEKLADGGAISYNEIKSHLKDEKVFGFFNKKAINFTELDSIVRTEENKSEYLLMKNTLKHIVRPVMLANGGKISQWKMKRTDTLYQIPRFGIFYTTDITYEVKGTITIKDRKYYHISYTLAPGDLYGSDKVSKAQGLDISLSGKGNITGNLYYDMQTGILLKGDEKADFTFNMIMTTSQRQIVNPLTFSYEMKVQRMDD